MAAHMSDNQDIWATIWRNKVNGSSYEWQPRHMSNHLKKKGKCPLMWAVWRLTCMCFSLCPQASYLLSCASCVLSCAYCLLPLVMCLLRLVMCLLPLASWSIACHLLPHAFFLFPWPSTYGHLPVAFCLASASGVLALAYVMCLLRLIMW
jgi:hypothetical protein